MPTPDRSRKGGTPNRGPAAARDNRDALLDAARIVFAERGYDAPLSAIAKAAGVGQGVLYRHFPDRLSLASAVFQANLQRYEDLAATPDGTTFCTLWRLVCEDMVTSAAFVEMAIEARRTSRMAEDASRIQHVVETALPAALSAGTVAPDMTVDEFLLAVRMAYGIVATNVDSSDAALLATLLGAFPRLAGRG